MLLALFSMALMLVSFLMKLPMVKIPFHPLASWQRYVLRPKDALTINKLSMILDFTQLPHLAPLKQSLHRQFQQS
jgi:hypothetical protein